MKDRMLAALEYAKLGMQVFPAPPGEKKSRKSREYSGQLWGKTSDLQEIQSDFRKWPNSNVCIATGSESGCFVIEADTVQGHGVDGVGALMDLFEAHGDLPHTPQALSPSGSWHLYFRYPEGQEVRNSVSKVAEGVDVRAEGGMVVAPPSRKPGVATPYRWVKSPKDVPLAECPKWLLDRVQAQADRRHSEATKPTATPSELEHIRHLLRTVNNVIEDREDWVSLALGLKHSCGDEMRADFIEFSYRWPFAQSGDPERLWDTARPDGRVSIGTALYLLTRHLDGELTEDGVARAFATKFGGRFRYDHQIGAWFVWDGSCWQRDQTDQAYEHCREIARDLSKPAKKGLKSSARRASFAGGAERMARSDPALAVTQEIWDADPYLLGCPSCTVDLRTGEARSPDATDGISKQTATDPGASNSAQWLKFINEATGGDSQLIRFLQQWCGYSLTGDTSEHSLLFVYGSGGNGKSVFLETLTYILGSYATTAAMDTFTASRSDKHPTDLAMLKGARLVTASETEEGRAWAETRIKQVTGGDRITARFMRQDAFTYQPQFKLTLVGNHMPVLRNVDDAARRRFNIVPFTRTPPNKDKHLSSKLKAEAPGILNWMIQGCLDWQENGLTRPGCVTKATSQYFDGQDVMGQFFAGWCQVDPSNAELETTSGDIYDAWKHFARLNGEEPGTQRRLAGAMTKMGLQSGRRRRQGSLDRVWRGIALLHRPETSDF